LQSTQEMLFLRQITLVCECFLKNNKETPSPKLYEILRELHGKRFQLFIILDLIFDLGISSLGTILQENIALLCEIVYIQFPNEEMSHELVPQTIPLLLANSLQKNAKKNDVKRVWNMREALNLLEYEEESLLQELLLRCIISPLYLNSVDGKKFLYFIFNMNPVLIELVHSTIVAQVRNFSLKLFKRFQVQRIQF
jgi:hypothetical protein